MAEQIGNLNGTCDLRLQQHFSFIKCIGITLQKMSSIALQSSAFNQEEFDYTSQQPDNVHQKDTLLKKLIRKGHHSCELFLQELARSGYEEEVNICLSEHNVTSEKIEQNIDYIASNLEIGIVLDKLFERQLITIDEHDGVQKKVTKPEKRRTLLSLLLSRPDTNWLSGFIRVLENTGHDNLLKHLRWHVSNGQELPELPYIRLGQTLPFDFIASLSSNSIQSEEMDVISLQMVQQVIQEALDTDVIEIWEGSIYFYLSTFSPDKILAILNGNDDAKLMKFLQLLFSKNKYLLHQFQKDTVVQFELEEKPEHIFINTFYGRWKSQIPTNKDEFCSGCYQTTLRANYKTVLDEIEDDIILDTLTRLEKVEKPKYQLHSTQSILRNKTRSEKAFTFLQYVLGNEHVLYEFSKAFEYHSQVELEGVKCRNCSSPEGVLIPSLRRKRKFHFTISMNNFDQIEITNIEKELMTPSVALRPILDDKTATALRSIMETICNPCSEKNKRLVAEKYCSDCEEKLCTECAEWHLQCKEFRSHHVIDLLSVGSRIPPSSKINCEIHTDVQIDYFCSRHDVVCCRACLSESHRSCESVLPLDSASKDVKKSSLLSDTLEEQDYMTETLQKIEGNRDENLKLLKQKKSLIIKQISAAKSKVPKYLGDIEKRLITEVESAQEKNEEKINREKREICQLSSMLKDNKQELEFLKDHGSNNQLFLTLRKQITILQKTDKKIHDMSSAINEIDMEFKENKNVNIETIGSLSQITRPCPIKYKSMKAQHPQVEVDRSQTLTEFIKEFKVELKRGQYMLSDIAVTSDNKLLLCNYSDKKVYIYKDYKTYEDEISFTSKPWCITVVPCTDKAVVTLSMERSIQFINTTNNTKDNKINIGEGCEGVTAGKDKIYIGGYDKVIILNTDGSRVREITTGGGFNHNLLYNERNDQLLLRQGGRLCCINLDGHVIYRYDISGHLGLAVDQQGHVYISGADDIHRLSPDGTFRDIVLSKHDGVDVPRSITFNNDFTKLFIINGGGESVLVYSCK